MSATEHVFPRGTWRIVLLFSFFCSGFTLLTCLDPESLLAFPAVWIIYLFLIFALQPLRKQPERLLLARRLLLQILKWSVILIMLGFTLYFLFWGLEKVDPLNSSVFD